MIIREKSHSVTGTYHLYDLLDIETSSGAVSITVVTESAARNKSVNDIAELNIATSSGSITLKMVPGPGFSLFGSGSSEVTTTNQIAPRTYRINLSSQSGTISGSVLVGGPNGHGSTSVSTKSGSINISVHPLTSEAGSLEKQTNGTNQLVTETRSGSQSVRVKSPVGAPGYKLDNLVASHVVRGSGSLNIFYPDEWMGIVHAKGLGHGSVQARGRDLEFGMRGSREVYAWRGRGDNLKTVSVVGEGSGSIQFNC